MERIKTFDIEAQPTARGVKANLAQLVDTTINGWLQENPQIDNIRISHAARPQDSFPRAFIIVVYEEGGKEVEEDTAPPGNEGGAPGDAPEPKRRRGRTPKAQ